MYNMVLSNHNALTTQNNVLPTFKDNGVFSANNYMSTSVGGRGRRLKKHRKNTRKYNGGKINKGRRTRRS